MTVIGLVGGMAAGKSTVAGFFGGRGAVVIDCDKLAKELVEVGTEHWARVASSFGPEYLFDNGTLNRKLLGQYVFNNRKALSLLNSLTHPPVLERVKEYLANMGDYQGLVVVEAAGLVEGGLYKLCDHICLVQALYGTQIERIMKRNGLNRDEAAARLSGQAETRVIARYCDIVIDTSGDLTQVSKQVDDIIEFTTRKWRNGSV